MKKILILAFSLIFALTFVACSDNTTMDNNTSGGNSDGNIVSDVVSNSNSALSDVISKGDNAVSDMMSNNTDASGSANQATSSQDTASK